jgi:hypothetical protein
MNKKKIIRQKGDVLPNSLFALPIPNNSYRMPGNK